MVIMKKTDTIAFYRDAYLNGKSDEEIRMFDEKGIDKQYGSIMAWKRRSRLAAESQGRKEEKEAVSVISIVALLRKVKTDIRSLERLNDTDREKLHEALEGAMDEVNNFDRYKMEKLIRELEDKRQEINKEEENLRRQIEELRQQLG